MVPELPRESKLTIVAGFLCVTAVAGIVFTDSKTTIWVLVAVFFLSGFLSDLMTAFFHFGFDYVFPYSTPILGPIARSFRIHHDDPDLDPSSYIENLTRGAQAAIPLSLIALAIPRKSGLALFLLSATIAGISIWSLFFHQIHSYCHMGAHLKGEDYIKRVAEIETLPTHRERKRELKNLFETVPIPPSIRLLQNCRLLLNPTVHNLHHMSFESDFSSVNGWSDWLTNPLFRTLARRYKSASLQTIKNDAPRVSETEAISGSPLPRHQ